MSTGQMFGSSKVPRVYKIVILGDGGVGKTALTQQFVYHRFPDRHDPTIEEIYRQQAVIDNEAAQIDILDTAGQPEFTAMRNQYMREGEGFIICYSISDLRTLEEVRTYKRLIDRVRNRDDIPIVLAGNKCDLDEKRQVDKLEGQTLAKLYGCPFYETSARKRLCVEEVFHELVRQIRLSEQQNNPVIRKQSRRTKLIKRMRNFFTGMSDSRR